MVDRQRGGEERECMNFKLLKRYKVKVFLCKCIPLEARMNLSLSPSISLSPRRRYWQTERQSDRQTDRHPDWLIKEYGHRSYFVHTVIFHFHINLYQFPDIHHLSPLHFLYFVKNSLHSSYSVLVSAGLYDEKTNELDSPVWKCSLKT